MGTEQVRSRLIPPTDYVCVPGNFVSYDGQSFQRSCGTRWTYMASANPVGFRVNFRPKHKLQPFIDSHLGAFLAPHNEPVDGSSSFNFTFKFGAGLELYRNSGKSFAVEVSVATFFKCLHKLRQSWRRQSACQSYVLLWKQIPSVSMMCVTN